MAAKTSKGKPKKEAPKSKKKSSKKKILTEISAPAEATVAPPEAVAEAVAPFVQETAPSAPEPVKPAPVPESPVAQPVAKPAPQKAFTDFFNLIKGIMDNWLGTRRRSVEEAMAFVKKGKEQYVNTTYRIDPQHKDRCIITVQWGADSKDLPSYKLWVSGKK